MSIESSDTTKLYWITEVSNASFFFVQQNPNSNLLDLDLQGKKPRPDVWNSKKILFNESITSCIWN